MIMKKEDSFCRYGLLGYPHKTQKREQLTYYADTFFCIIHIHKNISKNHSTISTPCINLIILRRRNMVNFAK